MGDKLLLRDVLPGTSHFVPFIIPTREGNVVASCPSQLNAGLELHREGGAGGCYCSKTDGDRRRGVRVTTYNVTSPSGRCRKKQRHQGAAESVLLPGPFQTPSLSSVGSESWAWDRSLPHQHHAPTEVDDKGGSAKPGERGGPGSFLAPQGKCPTRPTAASDWPAQENQPLLQGGDHGTKLL